MSGDPAVLEQRLGLLAEAVWRSLQGDTSVKIEPTRDEGALESLTEGLQVMLEELQKQHRHEAETTERLGELTETMVALAARDFRNLAPLRRDGGAFDTVAIGLRMLAEELEASTVSNDYVLGIINSMSDVLFVTEPDGSIKTVNRAACRLIGRSEDELLGLRFGSLLGASDGQPSFEHLLQHDGSHGIDVEFVGRDGAHVPMQVNVSMIQSLEGELASVIIVGRDMRETRRLLAAEAASDAEREKADELKKAYDQLRETQFMLIQTAKLTALGELAASVAHELNQPLNNIKLIMQAVLRDLRQDRYDLASLAEDAKEIVEIVGKMAGIINHMRTFARKPDENLRVRVDLNKTITDALRMLREQLRLNSVELEEHLAPNLPAVMGDPNNLEQVVLNLLTNARDSVIERVQSGVGSSGKIRVTSQRMGEDKLSIEVSDNGRGIPETICERLFEPFFTTKEPGKGTGLGLAIAERVSAEYGGTIEVDSKEGEGATFRVILPAAT